VGAHFFSTHFDQGDFCLGKKFRTLFVRGAWVVLAAGCALQSAWAQTASANGLVRKVDAANSRIIIKHGEWRGLNMGAMTMAFPVRDASLLRGVSVGDTVFFTVEKARGEFEVTGLRRLDQGEAQALQEPAVVSRAERSESRHQHRHSH